MENPPPPQIHTTSQQFVGYETDKYRRAHAFAKAELARMYPKSVEYLEAEQSLLNQHLNAQS